MVQNVPIMVLLSFASVRKNLAMLSALFLTSPRTNKVVSPLRGYENDIMSPRFPCGFE